MTQTTPIVSRLPIPDVLFPPSPASRGSAKHVFLVIGWLVASQFVILQTSKISFVSHLFIRRSEKKKKNTLLYLFPLPMVPRALFSSPQPLYDTKRPLRWRREVELYRDTKICKICQPKYFFGWIHLKLRPDINKCHLNRNHSLRRATYLVSEKIDSF